MLTMNTKASRSGGAMDFIERLFRMTPDGGSGAYELFLVLVPFLAMTVREFTVYRARRRQLHSAARNTVPNRSATANV